MAELEGLLADAGLLRDKGYIDGGWVPADSRLAVHDPATGEVVAQVAKLDAAQSRAAVDAAQRAFAGWSTDLPQHRGGLLRRWFELICQHREDLALIMVAEQGKPLSEALGEIDYAASFVEFYAEEAKRPNIEGVTSHLPDAEVEVWREPVGVAALVTPWNFPAAMLTRKAGAALAAGCTVVSHPSAETPLSALALAELAGRAGLPDGVFNVVPGDAPEIVGAWMDDVRVRALSFTGSTEIGRLLYRQAAADGETAGAGARRACARSSSSPMPTWNWRWTRRSWRNSPLPGRTALAPTASMSSARFTTSSAQGSPNG
jgi:aspartate-semialdehyde dehydrogenase